MERLLTIFVVLCIGQALAESSSPLLIWNNHEPPVKIPAISALQNTSYSSLWKDYLQAFPSDNIILFMQDALSIEDLTSFPHENAELSKLVSDSHSIYLPSVEETASLPRDFKNEGYNIVEVSKLQSGLNLKSDKNVVLVNLPDTLTIPQRNLAMQKTNEVIESVVSKIGGLRKFTSIFTARKSSKESSEVSNSSKRRVTRSLQQDSNRPSGFHNHTCALIYLRNDITVNVIDSAGISKPFTISNNKSVAELDTGHCADGVSASVQITYRDVEVPGSTTPQEVRLEFHFKFVRTKWTLHQVEGNLDTKSNRDLVFQMNKRENEIVPQKMSYSCSVRRILTTPNRTKDGNTLQMVLNGFQYEAFPTTKTSRAKFDGAWDCVGFFTVPLWMSLISVFIFLLILFWGLWMLADVKTMDRFDDPKGKTIVVPNTE